MTISRREGTTIEESSVLHLPLVGSVVLVVAMALLAFALSAALAAQTITPRTRDAVTNLVLGSGDSELKVGEYPPALRAEVQRYLSRFKAYRSTRRLPANADGIAKMSHGRHINLERALAATSSDPRAPRAAVEYVNALAPCYEWEGLPDCPEEEAIFAEKYQMEHPDGPFRDALPLFTARLWLCVAEFSKTDNEKSARARQAYGKHISVALKSTSLLLRTAAEGLHARNRCY